jgi:hypothetical protein
MWIIASIPFWIAGAVAVVISIVVLVYAFVCPDKIEDEKFGKGITGASFGLLLFGGALFILAAKIAS